MIGYTPDILSRGRELARTRMRAVVVVRRQVGTTRDPATGDVVPQFEQVYPPAGADWVGIAELRVTDREPRTGDAAGRRFAELGPFVALPVDGVEAVATSAVRFDDIGEVLTDPDNPGNVGTTFRVTSQHVKSLATARRLPVEVVSYT